MEGNAQKQKSERSIRDFPGANRIEKGADSSPDSFSYTLWSVSSDTKITDTLWALLQVFKAPNGTCRQFAYSRQFYEEGLENKIAKAVWSLEEMALSA